MSPSLDIPAPPDVSPVEIGPIRFEQVMDPRDEGVEALSGYMKAVDTRSGETLWLREIYPVSYDPEMERDVQGLYFNAMQASDTGDAILVTNEDNARFSVDAATGDATPLD